MSLEVLGQLSQGGNDSSNSKFICLAKAELLGPNRVLKSPRIKIWADGLASRLRLARFSTSIQELFREEDGGGK